MLNRYIFGIVLLLTYSAHAEIITCKGKMPDNATVSFELTINMKKNRSTIQYMSDIYPTSPVLQGWGLANKRVFKSPSIVQYQDRTDKNEYLELTLNKGQIQGARLNKKMAGFDNTAVNCELEGSIVAIPTCNPLKKNAALLSAVQTNAGLEAIEWELGCGADINYKDKKGCNALLYALDVGCGETKAAYHGPAGGAFAKSGELVDFLVSSGALVDSIDPADGATSLLKAAKYSVPDVYSSFVAAEANFDAKDKSGYTPLMYAAYNGNASIVKDILNGNPDRRIKNKDGKTAYDIAQHWQQNSVVNLVRPPDTTVTVTGQADGTCSPLRIEVTRGQVVEFALKATDKMFKLVATRLELEIMADQNSTVKQTISLDEPGTFSFSCGFHGGNSSARGEIIIK